MSVRGKQLVLVAFFVALVLSTMLYLLSRSRPREVANPLGGAWWDDFGSNSYTRKDEGVYRDSDGVRLSQVHDLGNPVPGASTLGDMVIGPDGRLFGTVYISETRASHLFTYDPTNDEFLDLGKLASEGEITVMAFEGDGRLCAGVTPQDESEQAYLLTYDLESTRVQSVSFPFAGKRWIPVLAMASDGSVYGAAGDHLFHYDPLEDKITDLGVPLGAVDILGLTLSDEGRLYGAGDHRAPYLFEYDLEARTVITLTDVVKVDVDPAWCNACDDDVGLVMSKGKRLYTEVEDWWLLCYDLTHDTVTIDESLGQRDRSLDIRELTAGSDGAICGVASSYYRSRVFCYSPATGDLTYPDEIQAKDGLPYECTWNSELAVSADGSIYLSQEERSTYVPLEERFRKFWTDLEREGLPMGRGTPLPPYTPREVAYQGVRLLAYKPEAYVHQGSIESELIEPHPLVVTHTQVTGDRATIVGLAWGSDGALYGAVSPSYYADLEERRRSYNNSLFRYLPGEPERVAWMDPWLQGATELVGTPDGLLVAAVDQNLVSYDPVNGTVITATLPISPTAGAAKLVAGQDGYVYGSTYGSKRHDGPSHVFVYSPTVGTVVDLGIPFTTTEVIYSLTVAPDGRVYGGAGSLFVYNPTTQSMTHIPTECGVQELVAGPDGKIYIGTSSQWWPEPDGRLFVYDPVADALTELSLPATSQHVAERENVISLAVSDDGLLYGSLGRGYVFVYDPRYPNVPPKPVATAIGTDLILHPGPDGVMYGAVGSYGSYYGPGASLIAFSAHCTSGAVGAWQRVTWEAETPPGTRIVVDVLDQEGNVLLRNVRNGGPFWSIDPAEYPAIRLRATLSTRDERVTPVLKNWRVDYTFECQQ